MAITNAQQYQQLVNKPANGKRPGYRGIGEYQSGKSGKKTVKSVSPGAGNSRRTTPVNTGSYDEAGVNQGSGVTAKDREIIGGGLTTQRSKFVDRRNYPKIKLGLFDILTGGKATKKFVDFSSARNRPYFYDKVIKEGKLDPKKFGISYYNLQDYTDDELEDAYQKYDRARLKGEIDAFGNPIVTYGKDQGEYSDNIMSEYEKRLLALEEAAAGTPKVEDDQIINYRLLADGGRIGFNMGGGQFTSGDDISPGTDVKGNIREDNPFLGREPEGPKVNLNNITPVKADSRFNFGKNIGKGLPPKELARLFNEFYNLNTENEPSSTVYSSDMDGPSSTVYSSGMDGPETISLGSGLAENAKQDIIENKQLGVSALSEAEAELMRQGLLGKPVAKAEGGRIGFMEGGMPYEGGIMDLETSRQQYGLGKLVKKITRGVKKIAKSPIGKAALLAAGGYYLGGGSLGGILKSRPGFSFGQLGSSLGFGKLSGGVENSFTGGPFSNIANFVRDKYTSTGGKIGAGILGISALSGLMTKQDEDDNDELYAGADLPNPVDYYLSGKYSPNRRLAAEGGSMDEPVAKKTMPLLNMDGQEMDLRAEGGFVPIGRMEKADDVPARLSKNEFVFTAEAVRNAGEGDVDKGAEVMYNMMKNLESGGEVSEESQGLEGAREMFQTSQRLEEVI